ncbi:hypothetical protein BGZ92_006995, partial [Podila epicladia]
MLRSTDTLRLSPLIFSINLNTTTNTLRVTNRWHLVRVKWKSILPLSIHLHLAGINACLDTPLLHRPRLPPAFPRQALFILQDHRRLAHPRTTLDTQQVPLNHPTTHSIVLQDLLRDTSITQSLNRDLNRDSHSLKELWRLM